MNSPIHRLRPGDVGSRAGMVCGKNRHGAIAVLTAVMLVMVLGIVAFAVDLGFLAMARTETQRTADATAHAAAIEFARSGEINAAIEYAYRASGDYAAANPVLGEAAAVDRHVDVIVGRYEFGSGQSDLQFGDPATYNAVKVRIRRTEEQNGAVPLFFASVFGQYQQAVESEAIAAIIRNVKGFKIPPSGENVPLMPIAVKESYWNKAYGRGHAGDRDDLDDNWSYDPETGRVTSGSDGKPEIRLFPTKTGSSGNLGTVNIGVSNNSTSYLGKQIRKGLNQSALDHYGGSLELGSNGELELSGDPGLSAGIKDDLKAIVGEVRAIPIYRGVSGNGNNARYTIVGFVAARIMSAQLSGGDKAIILQQASLTFDGAIQGSVSGQSQGIYSSPRIVN